MHADIAVVGGGIAAASAVLALRKAGRSIAVVAPQPKSGEIIGESLSPSANPILKDLGIWEAFLQEKHAPSVINFSSWGSDQLIQRDFGQHPSGSGWSLDRQRFERFLWKEAHKVKHQRCSTSLHRLEKTEHGWNLNLRDGSTLDARFVLDCSGRSATVARRLADRQRDTCMTAAFSFLEQTDLEVEPTQAVMIEARPNGWWYSALTPSGRMAVCFFSDTELLPSNLQRDRNLWTSLTQSAPYTWKRIETAGFSIGDAPQLTDAGSLFSTTFTGDGWAAAGDAVASLDPLSSHGMTSALWSGRKAALAAHDLLNADNSAMEQYVEAFQEGLTHYREELKQFYQQERRFPDAPFWQRRQYALASP